MAANQRMYWILPVQESRQHAKAGLQLAATPAQKPMQPPAQPPAQPSTAQACTAQSSPAQPAHLSAATRSLSAWRVPTAAPTSRRPSGATEAGPAGAPGAAWGASKRGVAGWPHAGKARRSSHALKPACRPPHRIAPGALPQASQASHLSAMHHPMTQPWHQRPGTRATQPQATQPQASQL